MDWIADMKSAIACIEKRLMDENLKPETIAREVAISAFYFQKGFSIFTGYTIKEYIRNRRLYLAAMDIARGEKIIDVAYNYGYDTPESFSKAFSRFHGVAPSQIKGDTSKIRVFLPLKIQVTVTGGYDMDYEIKKMKSFKLIGFCREFNVETSYKEIPKFWGEVFAKHEKSLFNGESPKNDIEKAIVKNKIGEYGVCIDDIEGYGNFRYMVAGEYKGGEVPEGLTIYEVPELQWAKFHCVGPMPEALQTVNTAIFKEWLPTNGKYEMSSGLNIEWYSPEGNTDDVDYNSGIWIPVKEK